MNQDKRIKEKMQLIIDGLCQSLKNDTLLLINAREVFDSIGHVEASKQLRKAINNLSDAEDSIKKIIF